MDWQFTLAFATGIPAFVVFCKHIWVGKDRSWHALYCALLIMVVGIFGISLASGNSSTVPEMMPVLVPFSFAMAGFLGLHWGRLSKEPRNSDSVQEDRRANERFEKLRFTGAIVYTVSLTPVYNWHSTILSGSTTVALAFSLLFAGVLVGVLLYRGRYGTLALVSTLILFLLIAIGSNIDPVFLKDYYLPFGMIWLSAAILIGMLPETPLGLWRRIHAKS